MIPIIGLEPEGSLFGYHLDEIGTQRGSSSHQSLFDAVCHGPEEVGEPWEAAWIDLGGEG